MKREFAVPVLSFLALEIMLRIFLGNMAVVKTRRTPPDGRCIGLVPDTVTVYTGWLGKIPPVSHSVNSYGYRGTPRSPEKPPGTFRIAFLGDSFVFGQGVKDEETLAFYLEQELKSLKQRIEVLNFGIPGHNFGDFQEQFQYFASRWEPDLVLLFLFENDLDPPLCKSVTDFPLFSFLIKHIYSARTLFLLANIATSQKKKELQGAKKELKKHLQELKKLIEAKKATFAVIILSNPLGPGRQEEKELMRLLQSLVIPELNCSFWLDPSSPRALPKIPKEGHLNAEGNKKAAREIKKWLMRKHFLQKNAF